MSIRSQGFVMAEDNGVFKVKVTTGPFAGKKLRVVSTKAALAVRIDVDFIVGTIQGEHETYEVACDVVPIPALPKCQHPGCQKPSEASLEVGSSETSSVIYVHTCLPHILQQIRHAETINVFGPRRIRIASTIGNDKSWQPLHGRY